METLLRVCYEKSTMLISNYLAGLSENCIILYVNHGSHAISPQEPMIAEHMGKYQSFHLYMHEKLE